MLNNMMNGVSSFAVAAVSRAASKNVLIGAGMVACAAINAAAVIGVYEYGGQALRAVANGASAAVEYVSEGIVGVFTGPKLGTITIDSSAGTEPPVNNLPLAI